ncbi:304_t:CDS:10 [Cetraspora pellucida]|uniref:304_t:CDS:1 n=1 Tax=Cetraspora pellucida TaxID=1433469 RepID=A0ACA9L7U0_9GLOM|nr:304_t:CDS:10 [Cetraspora pellucida]
MEYQISTSQPTAISSDNEWDLFETSQDVNDFENEQGPNNKQNSDDEWNSESSNESIQDPEYPSTWKFNEQPTVLNVDEITEEIEEIDETSEDGVACVYNVAGMDTEKALEIFDLKNIQYSYKDGTTCESQEDDTSAPTYFIGCENFKNSECGHQYQSLSGCINIEYLKKLFCEHIYYNNGIIEEISDSIRHCYTILPYKNSEVVQGLIQTKSKCPVKFWHYVPEDLENSIQNDLKDIIAEEDILDLTARKLITRTSMQRFLKGVPLLELHPSLNNRSKIEHMIATKCCAEHPYVFAHAFTILQTANTYKKLFEELFTCVEQDCGHSVEFQHIHSHGIGCILADEHYDQALAYEVMNTLEFLEHCEIPGIADWVQDKKQPWILAGLSPAFTKMEQTIWTSTPFTTNAEESAHANINRNGHNLSLLAAINKAKEFDKHQWSSAFTYERTNVTESYQNKSSLQRTTEAVKKTCEGKHSNKTSVHQKSPKKARVTNESINIEEQERLLRIEQEKLAIQKNKNNELEKEIMLRKKLQKLQKLLNS